VQVPQSGGGTWNPQNYDARFEGPMPMRRGLYQSRNIVAIKVGMELGAQSVIDMARKFGITTPIPPYPSIFIGAADVYPLEMVAAYSAFATLGTRSAPTAIVRVENSRGDVLWEPTPVRTPVMSPEEAWLMVNMMKDVVRRGTAAGSVGANFQIPAGGKTGTTNDGADVWFIGYTSDLVAGVWMGLDRPKTIKGNAQGGILAAPAWTSFMNEVYRRKPSPPDWPRPEGIVTRQIDPASGQLVGPGCEPGVSEVFILGTDPTSNCVPSYGQPGLPGSTIDTTFGLPPVSRPPSAGQIIRTDTGSQLPPPPPITGTGSVIIPGATPIPRATRPVPRPRDTTRIFRDTARTPRDTANPFTLPPRE
jgi:penicillin-binding protein 1A